MIVDFSFKNYKSYKSAQNFTMRRDTSITAKNVSIKNVLTPKEGVNRVTAIYGSNASGKTNLLNAIAALRNLVIHDSFEGIKTFFDNNDTTDFYIHFIYKEKKYNYTLSIKDDTVVAEKLETFNSQKPAAVYSYDPVSDNIISNVLKSDEKTALKYNFRNNHGKTILSYLKNSENKDINNALGFFSDGIKLLNATRMSRERFSAKYEKATKDKVEYLDVINSMIAAADFGITGIKMQEEIDGMTTEQKRIMLEAIFEVDRLGEKRFSDKEKNDMRALLETGEKEHFARFMHRHEKSLTSFDIMDESNGTIAASYLFLDMMNVLKNGAVFVVDEIDCSLHPSILSQVVEVFNSEDTNPMGAQLIFTTHDVSLLDQSIRQEQLMDRDQIWLVDKRPNGESVAYALSDMSNSSPRKNENLYRRYMLGYFGGTPGLSLVHEVQKYWEMRNV